MEQYVIEGPSRAGDGDILYYKEHDRGSATFCGKVESAKKFSTKEEAETTLNEVGNKAKNYQVVQCISDK